MIDVERRKKLAFHLRQLSVGLTTNDDFENNIAYDVSYGWLPEQYYRSKQVKHDDAVIVPMLELCWGLYNDTKSHKLKGKYALNQEAEIIIARSILFLHSNREYEWPYIQIVLIGSITDLLSGIVTLGYTWRARNRKLQKAFEEHKKLGDYHVWPFFRNSDYQEQLQKQPFLNNTKKAAQ